MGKEKIKIRYIIFVLITMGVIFFGKITRLDNLNAEKIAGIILVSPPYKKRITGQQKIEEFTILFNDRKKKPVFSIEIYAIIDGNPIVIYKDHASDNHAGWRWYYLTVVDHKNYILQYTPEIWNGIGNYHFEIFSFNQKGQKEILETQELPYDSIHTSEDNKQDLLIKTQNFKAIYEKWQTNSIPLITIGSDPLTGDNDNYVLEKKSNIE